MSASIGAVVQWVNNWLNLVEGAHACFQANWFDRTWCWYRWCWAYHAGFLQGVSREVQSTRRRQVISINSSSIWASPCFLWSKKYSFSLPMMTDSVGPAEYICKLGLLKGYWQVPCSKSQRSMWFVTSGLFSKDFSHHVIFSKTYLEKTSVKIVAYRNGSK